MSNPWVAFEHDKKGIANIMYVALLEYSCTISKLYTEYHL